MRSLVFALCFLPALLLQAQVSNSYVSPALPDTLFVQAHEQLGMIALQRVEPRQTLYGIARHFRSDFEALYRVNPGIQQKGLQPGQELIIPIQKGLLLDKIPPRGQASALPVCYRVQGKETLYRISQQYFKMPAERIQRLNKMATDQVNEGQVLLLGYLMSSPEEDKPIAAVAEPKAPRKNPEPTASPAPVKNLPAARPDKNPEASSTTAVRDLLREEGIRQSEEEEKSLEEEFKKPGVKYLAKTEKGVAFWHKESHLAKGTFVLHPTAAINSLMAISANGKTVMAKVVGNIPPNTYPKDILIIVSPQVARELGALDARFFAKLKYTAEVLPVNEQ